MASALTLLWLRQDLRLSDHPALNESVQRRQVLPVYILDDTSPNVWSRGAASRWWLHQTLADLSKNYAALGAPLCLRRGDPAVILPKLAKEVGADTVFWSRLYDPSSRRRDEQIRRILEDQGRVVQTFNASLLFEPQDIRTKTGGPYKVYTPFARTCFPSLGEVRAIKLPKSIQAVADVPSDRLEDWGLCPQKPDWSKTIAESWQAGEEAAQSLLKKFLADGLSSYHTDRDRPDREGTSRLSPYLALGVLSPRQIVQAVWPAMVEDSTKAAGAECYLKEILWREFSYHLLYHFPDLPDAPLRKEFAAFPWVKDLPALELWQKGLTGYPIVDAGMRQLWQTGWMHNRVRMIVASFLVKDLLLPWREGEAWFWDTLIDADLASNAASWQWVAGCGADAAPFFRIFNPVLQGQKFDPDGDYVRRFVPELAGIKGKAIHAPWLLSKQELRAAGVVLGQTYPKPIVDHAKARERALAALNDH